MESFQDYEGELTGSFTGAAFLVHALVQAGVTHVFGGHGGAVVPLIDAIEAHPDITWVYARCEVNASQMALAYAKLHQRLGCCIATSGPGAAHLLSGLVDADQDRVPVICITGMKDSGHLRHADFQDIDQGSIFRMAGLALSETVGHIDQLLPLTRNAFTIATTSNRCAHLAVPINIQQETIMARKQFCLGKAYKIGAATPATQLEVDTLIMALRTEMECNRHVLIACGYRAHKVGPLVERLAELLHAPILTSYDGKGTVNERHPLAFGVVGVYGNAGTAGSVNLLDDCDTVISICSNDLTELVASKSGLQIRRLIQIDERLVAGDTMRFSPNAVFACGKLQGALTRVIAGLEASMKQDCEHVVSKKRMTVADLSRYSRRLTGMQAFDFSEITTHEPETSQDIWEELKKENFTKPTGTPSTYLEGKLFSETNAAELESTEYCNPAVFFDAMKDSLQEDAVICADVGDNALWMASALAAKRGQSFLTSEHMGIMGMALNAGLASSVSSARQTLVVAGDGGFQMSLNELATMKDHGSRNVLVVVIVNKRLGRVQNETWGPTLHADGCSIGAPNFVKLFDAYGYPNGQVLSTCDADTVKSTIDQGWKMAADHGVAVIELHQDPLTHPIMHKLKSAPGHVKGRKSLADYKAKTRNPKGEALFPSLSTCWEPTVQTSLQDWLNGLTAVEKSTPYWLNKFDFVSMSPSNIIQDVLLPSLTDLPPMYEKMFPTQAKMTKFDSHFKGSFLNAFPDDIAEEILYNGQSNSHPMCLQLLACPKDYAFNKHAHANAEFIIPLVGELGELRMPGAPIPPQMLRRKTPVPPASDGTNSRFDIPTDLQQIEAQLKQPGICQFLQPDNKTVMDRVVRQGQLLYNPPGSVHQSYTKENGSLLFVLWSGFHSNWETN